MGSGGLGRGFGNMCCIRIIVVLVVLNVWGLGVGGGVCGSGGLGRGVGDLFLCYCLLLFVLFLKFEQSGDLR